MIDWLPEDVLDTPGRLGLAASPGSGSAPRDVDLRRWRDAGARHVVCLQEAHELRCFEPPESIDARRAAVEAHGLTFLHVPIEDFGAPEPHTARDLVERIVGHLTAGQDVVLHCWAGLGRAGTIAACVLLARTPMSAAGAIAMVRWVRPGAIQSEAQERLIAEFASAR